MTSSEQVGRVELGKKGGPRIARALSAAFVRDVKLWKGDSWELENYRAKMYAEMLAPEFGPNVADRVYWVWTLRVFYHQNIGCRWLVYAFIGCLGSLFGAGNLLAVLIPPQHAELLAQLAANKWPCLMIAMSADYSRHRLWRLLGAWLQKRKRKKPGKNLFGR